jgi:predicted ribosome quality control (RQC) complex YloA/Tae2 family protein
VKSDKPLRFAEFLNSRIINSRIEEAVQLGDNRIVRLVLRRGPERWRFYVRLWSNAANVVVTGEDGVVLDAMRRLPKRGEVTGGIYRPEESAALGEFSGKDYQVRELEEGGSFNEKIDAWYSQRGGKLSLESLREEARRNCEGAIGRLRASLEKLRAKEADYASADRLKEYGDIILANLGTIRSGDQWIEAENFYAAPGGLIRIALDPKKSASAQAEDYYARYRKAKKGLGEVRAEIEAGQGELARLEKNLDALLSETNPLYLAKLLKTGGIKSSPARREDHPRPGLSFRRGDWLIIVGRSAAENDALLRRYVKGNDLWLHTRDYAGAYVFVKQRSGKTVPLEILLDAGNLALFYSKARNNGEGDLFYTPVKFLRRAKDGPKGLVIPTQEKNLHIKADEKRLRELETCKVV